MAKALASTSSHNFWNDINRSCSQRLPHAPVVDGIHREPEIVNVFSNNLSKLLSSSSSSSSDRLLGQFRGCLTSDDLRSVSVTPSFAWSAFNLLKPHKADGMSMFSDHFLFALPATEGFDVNLLLPVAFSVMVTCQLLCVVALLSLFLRAIKTPLLWTIIVLLL